jgi:hypothetical protein
MSAKAKPKQTYKVAHTPASSKGLGDYYGTGIRQPLGKLRDDTVGMVNLTPSELKKPPKSTA